DNRIVAIHKENGGVSSTRNRALREATGTYVQFLDADDWLPFDSTKLLVRAMEDSDADMVIGDFYRVVDDKVSRKGSIREAQVISRNEYADKMMLTPADFYYGVLWNKLFKKEILDAHHIFMDENISYCEDVIFNLEYLLHVRNVAVLKAPVYYYVKTEGSLVAQNMNIEKTVKMKTNVIGYYNDFYKNILDEDDYEQRKPIIYGYLVAFSTDAFAIPFVSDTRKLGEEDGPRIYYDQNLDDAGFMLRYLGQNLFDRLLNTVAQQNKLELNDVKILYVLYRTKKECGTEEISALSGVSTTACLASLTKLVALNRVKITDVSPFKEKKVSYSYNDYGSAALDSQLDKVTEDYAAISFEGMSEEEKESYLQSCHKIMENLKKITVR
ncbi:MAG: glycosyltransferase, partial [Erysipelotrichaceae bacterium]|nr:glycosyltransferase [Erysipelotrichaceae bacterium]